MRDKKKILALMSGGVDSSTAAALLVEKGYTVQGVYLKLWDDVDSETLRPTSYVLRPRLGDPCWAQEMRDAARVAAHLGIPFEVWDVTADYKKRVLENFYAEYAAGRTPNPDVLCNSEIKFGVALKRALKEGYDYVATGHYAKIHKTASSYQLAASSDRNKDQCYFLWRLTQNQLAHVRFPIGEYTKPQVRKMAQKFGLHNWNKKDSQGVCFLGKIELKEFLRPAIEEISGPIHDVHGILLGVHDGLAHFTIGQRHGGNIGNGHGPYYVVDKDMKHNALIVASEKDEPNYRAVECSLSGVQLNLSGFQSQVSWKGMARVRYRAPLVPVTVHFHTLAYESKGQVVFDTPQRAVAPGQSMVFYDGERVVGGGVIDAVRLSNEPRTNSKHEIRNPKKYQMTKI